MPKSKKSQIPKETTFQRLARWERNISTIAILIFVICYILGAFLHFGLSTAGYLKAAFVNAVLLTGVLAFMKFLQRKKSKESVVKTSKRLLIFFAIFFTHRPTSPRHRCPGRP